MEKTKFEIAEFNVPCQIITTALYFKISGLQFFKAMNYSITPEQFGLLHILSKENGLYQRQISQHMLKDRPNITRLIDILEEKGFLYRELDQENRRKIKVFITEDGMNIVNEILPSIIEMRDKALKGLTKDDFETLNKILGKIRNNLEENFVLQM